MVSGFAGRGRLLFVGNDRPQADIVYLATMRINNNEQQKKTLNNKKDTVWVRPDEG
jgi:hypothetical protein